MISSKSPYRERHFIIPKIHTPYSIIHIYYFLIIFLVSYVLVVGLIKGGFFFWCEEDYSKQNGRITHAKDKYSTRNKKDFDSKVMQYAEKLAEGPTVAQGFAKQSVIKGLEMSLSEGTALERSNQQILMATDDAAEGLDAFLTKRKPEFKGR